MFSLRIREWRHLCASQAPSSPRIRWRSMGRARAGLLTIVLAVANAPCVHSATIQGTVLDPSGAVVPGAKVTLLQDLAALQQTESDAKGRYRFEHVRGSAYTLVATAPGLSAPPQTVSVATTETGSLNLQLEISAAPQQVVVSASLGGALTPQIGSSISVVSRQEVQEHDAEGVLDALRGLPGVEINQTGRRGGVTSAFIRGGNSNYNLVMIDGIPMNQLGGL